MSGQAEAWFKLADQDGDGAVGGAEAVRFFTRSGLPQDVLGQIWELCSRGNAALNPMQFNTALRLVALAQAHGGRLPPDVARLVAVGSGPQLPPPRLAGLTETPPTPSIPTYTPQITGLTPQVTGSGPYSAQMTGSRPPYTHQVTGQRPPYAYMPPPGMPAAAAGPTGSGPPSGSYGPAPIPGPGAGVTGGPPSGGYTGAMPAAAAAAAAAAAGPTVGLVYPPGFTPPSAADMQRYVAVFASTDGDRDGLVKGSECFPVFIQSGLDKGVLKRMWDLVAGNAGHLSRDQFVRCMFLMDGLRRGLALPAVLPPGPWPQVAGPAAGLTGPKPAPTYQQPVPAVAAAAGGLGSRPSSMGGAGPAGIQFGPGISVTGGPYGSRPGSTGGAAPVAAAVLAAAGVTGGPLRAESWSLSSQFGHKGAVKAISEAYDQTLPKIPEPPGKVKYEGTAVPDSGPSAVPDLDAAVSSMLAPADKARWEAERAEAHKKESDQRQAEVEAANQKARLAAYQEALSELVMYKSRIDVALLQASDSAARLQSEAEDLELRYSRAQLAAQSQAEAGSKARQQLQALLTRKAEAITRLQVLQQELEMAQNLNPEELVALEREVGGLMAQQAAAEARKATLDMQLDSGRKQKSLLADRISELEMAAVAGEGELRRARDELEGLQGKVLSTQASSLGPDELGQVKPLLGKAASAYRRLYSTAAAAGIEVPYEANLNNVGSLVWLEQLMAGTADWADDDSAVSGYSVVNALPELEGAPPALLRAAALAAAAAPPVKHTMLQGKAAAAVEGAEAEAGKETATAEADSKEAPAAAAEAAPEAKQAAEVAAAPTPAAAKDAHVAAKASTGKAGAVVAVAAAGAAAVAAGAAVAAAGGGSPTKEDSTAAVPSAVESAADGADTTAAVAPAEDVTAVDADLPASAEVPADEDLPTAAAEADTAAAGDSTEVASADIIGSPPSAAAAGAGGAAAEDVVSPPAAAPKTLLEDSDSEVTDTPLSSGPGAAGYGGMGAAPFGGLAGFDPSMYRLPDEQRTLTQQHSIDSSYAGSFTAERRHSSIEAGATGASAAGFDDEPPAFGPGSGVSAAAAGATGSSVGGAGTASSNAAGAAATPGLGFEDNAF